MTLTRKKKRNNAKTQGGLPSSSGNDGIYRFVNSNREGIRTINGLRGNT